MTEACLTVRSVSSLTTQKKKKSPRKSAHQLEKKETRPASNQWLFQSLSSKASSVTFYCVESMSPFELGLPKSLLDEGN